MGALRLCITGAGSYVGRAAAEAALRAGHEVVAHSRYGHRASWPDGAQLEPVTCALDAPELAGLLNGCHAVLHVAGRMAGSEAEFQKDVVADSAALMRAASEAGVARVVLAGSVSVYEAGAPGDVITEESPLERQPDQRDGYMRAKLAQEGVMAQVAAETRVALSVLRLGAVWGPGRLWNAHIGLRKGPVLVRIGRDGQIPLCHIARAGEALVAAVSAPPATLNVLDDDLPDRIRYLNALGRAAPPLILPVGWRLPDALAMGLPAARMQGLLRRPALRARMMPLGWTGARARAALALAPQPPFEALMRQALNAGAAP